MQYGERLEKLLASYDPDQDVEQHGGAYGMRLADLMIETGKVRFGQKNSPLEETSNEFDPSRFKAYCAEQGITDPTSDRTEPGQLILGLEHAGLTQATAKGGKTKPLRELKPNQIRAIANRYI